MSIVFDRSAAEATNFINPAPPLRMSSAPSASSNPLTFTGERFLPNEQGEMWAEHWHRYHFVRPLLAGKRVLDVACGEGYGSALMAEVAASVTGVDVARDAITHAQHAYAGRTNLAFVEASCAALPLEDAQFDVVVSFETIEHIHEQDAFLDGVRRVLKPDGLLIISSPNKAEYSDARGYTNEFHVKELYRDELATMLAARFTHTSWYSQRNGFYSLIEREHPAGNPLEHPSNASIGAVFQPLSAQLADVTTISKNAPTQHAASLAPLYFLVFAANDPQALPATRLSAFTDAEEFAMNDYRNTYRAWMNLNTAHRALQATADARAAEIESLHAQLADAQKRVAPVPSERDSWLTRLIKKLSS
jgi:2-polyprenyl-3-methyl-5-hydroxy-6-metoxy-1,4-benzoquinol methylase